MHERAPAGVIVDGAQPDGQPVRGIGTAAVDRCATATAKGAEHARRGFELMDQVLAGEKAPVLPANVRVRRERRSARLPASRTMTVHDGSDLPGHVDPDPTAQATGAHARSPGCLTMG